MMKRKIIQVISAVFLISLLLLTSCSSKPPSRFDTAQQESVQAGNKNIAVVKEAEKGASFNKFFPSSSGEYERVFTQEKQGFVQAKLIKEGKEIAMLSIFDTLSNPSAKDEFKNSTQTIKDYPTVAKGANTTAVLVGDRFQVKITSRDASFNAEKRTLWLEKFNLDGLAKLK